MQRNLRSGLLAVFMSNTIAIVAGVATSFILPKIIGSVSEYGYWQLFFFYAGYYGLLLFGLNDGMNLIFAGKKLTRSDRRTMSLLFIYLLGILLVGTIATAVLGCIFIHDHTYLLLYAAVLINMIILNITGYTLHVNQILLRFKTYAKVNVLERILFAILLVPFWIISVKTYVYYIVAITLVRLAVMGYGVWGIRDVWSFGKRPFLGAIHDFRRLSKYVHVGFPITIGTIFSMLIITSSRIVVEKTHSIHDYGLFSLAFAVLSIVIMTVSTISAVLYPTLKNIESHKHADIYRTIRYAVTMISGISLLGCFLVPPTIQHFLPAYSGTNVYIFPLMAWVIYQCLGSIVNDAFLKVARMEWMLFLINIVAFFVIFVAQYITMLQSNSITTMLLVGLVGIMTWMHATKAFIYRKNGWSQHYIDYVDIPIVIVFLTIAHFDSGYIGFISYAIFLSVVLFIFRKRNSSICKHLRFTK